MIRHLKTYIFLCLLFSFGLAFSANRAQAVPSPESVLGFQPAADRTIADWQQIYLNPQTSAYFINSSAFEITDLTKVRAVARYAENEVLLSGWLLGEEFLNGKVALAEADYGRGKLVLFAFRPQHCGQTFGTFPFIFNALEKE